MGSYESASSPVIRNRLFFTVFAAFRGASGLNRKFRPLWPNGTEVTPAAALVMVLSCAIPECASAQEVASPEAPIIVSGARVGIPILPERSLDQEEVSSYGFSTLGELIDEIAQQNGEARSDPLVLINGQRVSGLGEIQDLPAEALVTIDILPIGSALGMGGSANQRVYSIKLANELDLTVVRAALRIAAQNHFTGLRGDLTQTSIRGNRRISLSAKVRLDKPLLESEADIVQLNQDQGDSGRFRSLLPKIESVVFGLAAADRISDWLVGSINVRSSIVARRAMLGLMPGFAAGALQQNGRTASISSDSTLVAEAGSWQISALGSFDRAERRSINMSTANGPIPPLAAVSASTSTSLRGSLGANGPLADLPAGTLRATLSVGAIRETLEGKQEVSGVRKALSTTQSTSFMTLGLVLPLTSRASDFLGRLGDVTANAEIGRQYVDRFGEFLNQTVSVTWLPQERLQFTASLARAGSAPSIERQGDPVLQTAGIRYFDPVRNETVDVTRITGGQPGLLRQRSNTLRVGMNIKPLRTNRLQLSAEYLDSRDNNVALELPPATLEVISKFSERFTRDSLGTLITVDSRPVNFAQRRQRQIRTGFNLTLPWGSEKSFAAVAEEQGQGTSTNGSGVPGRGSSRLQLSGEYVLLLDSQLQIAAGSSTIDLLSRDAVGLGGMGTPRHRIDSSIGYTERGLGIRVTSVYRSASLIEASGAISNVLRFAPLTTFSVRSWVQSERLFPTSHWAKGGRLTVTLANAGNVRERVTDRFGMTPLAYQQGYRDPLGRSFELELRKTF